MSSLSLFVLMGSPATAQLRSVDTLMSEAEAAMTAGKPEQARLMLQHVVSREPALASAHVQLGYVLIETNDTEGAEAAFRDAIRLEPALADAYAGLSKVLLRQYRPNAAEMAVMQALRFDEDNAIAYQTLGHLRYDQDRWQEAIDAYRVAINGAEYDSFLMSRASEAFVELEEWNAALGTLLEAVELDSDSSIRVDELADLYVAMGQPEEAEAAYLAALDRNPNNPWLYDYLGDFLYNQGRYEEGDNAKETALAVADSDASYVFYIALTSYMADGRLVEAESLFNRAIALEPNNPRFPIGIAQIRRRQNDLEGAAAAYQASLDIEPNSRYFIDMADILATLGRFDDAEAAYRNAVNASAGAGYAYIELGRFLASQERPTEALMSLYAARELGNQTETLEAEIEALTSQL